MTRKKRTTPRPGAGLTPSPCHTISARADLPPPGAGRTCSRTAGRCTVWDYPRSTGGADITSESSSDRGVSAGGGADFKRDRVGGVLRGTTPAQAGRTHARTFPTGRRWDYPRGGGADSTVPSTKVGGSGLSPHVRGGPLQTAVDRALTGTTPARAGPTPGRQGCDACRRDYPRTGGVTAYAKGNPQKPGTIPRTGGADASIGLDAVLPGQRIVRTTPAGAGRTPFQRQAEALHGDTPAPGGADKLLASLLCGIAGIPRRGGADSTVPSTKVGGRDYPRGGGADVLTDADLSGCLGLPPHRAGRTYYGWTPPSGRRDHPRTGGADNALGKSKADAAGLSPAEQGRPYL